MSGPGRETVQRRLRDNGFKLVPRYSRGGMQLFGWSENPFSAPVAHVSVGTEDGWEVTTVRLSGDSAGRLFAALAAVFALEEVEG